MLIWRKSFGGLNVSKVHLVSEVNEIIKSTLAANFLLHRIIVKGEISNYKKYDSGHAYFTLKDEKSVLKAVMFRSRSSLLRFKPQNGQSVLASGRIEVYERDGVYQIYVDNLFPDGAGDLALKYEEFTIKEIIDMNIDDLLNNKIFINSKKIISTLNSLIEIGLGYLTLFQETPTLSGGEAQRLKIIKYLNKNNKGKLYIIDEAFNGVDLNNISKTLVFFEKIIVKNTIILVEHNKYVLDCCDYIIEVGPGKGKYGGKIIKQYLNN